MVTTFQTECHHGYDKTELFKEVIAIHPPGRNKRRAVQSSERSELQPRLQKRSSEVRIEGTEQKREESPEDQSYKMQTAMRDRDPEGVECVNYYNRV
jgi:hypothetical protein